MEAVWRVVQQPIEEQGEQKGWEVEEKQMTQNVTCVANASKTSVSVTSVMVP